MKRLIFISLALLLGVMAKAQTGSRHSLELTTGYPELFSNIYPPGNLDNPATAEAERIGQKREALCPLNLTLTYSYRVVSRMALGVRINARGWLYNSNQYPEKGTGYDWKAEPVSSATKIETRGLATSLFGRYYWSDNGYRQWYSSIGVGINAFERYRLEPDLIPVGLHWGRKRCFGILELSLGTAGTGVLLGIGWRL